MSDKQNVTMLCFKKDKLYPVSVSGTFGLHVVSRAQETMCLLHEKQKMTTASPKKCFFG